MGFGGVGCLSGGSVNDGGAGEEGAGGGGGWRGGGEGVFLGGTGAPIEMMILPSAVSGITCIPARG